MSGGRRDLLDAIEIDALSALSGLLGSNELPVPSSKKHCAVQYNSRLCCSKQEGYRSLIRCWSVRLLQVRGLAEVDVQVKAI